MFETFKQIEKYWRELGERSKSCGFSESQNKQSSPILTKYRIGKMQTHCFSPSRSANN